ncbi:efflux RND transporter periplasmic adaptor subunit [bacterium]|nr:efflux RND transporter periplasmic adaptor subunit [bacterium]
MKKRILWIAGAAIVVVVVLVAVLGGRNGGRVSADTGGETAGAQRGATATAEIGDVSVILTEVGGIQPKTMVLVKSKVSGKILRLHAEEGQYVTRGMLVATIEPDMAQARTVATLKSGYGRARVNLERARQDYERDLALHEAGHVSDEELRLSKDDHDIARVDYRSALEQMRLAEADGVSMDLDAESEDILDVLAPTTGTIIDLSIEEGEIVTSGAVSYTSGSTLMTIANLETMQIAAGVNEVDIGKIRNGQDVIIDVDAYAATTFHGVISHIAPAARDEQGVKIFDVEITITDNDERLRPGMTANIEIQGDHCENCVTIPIEGAFRKNGGYVAYVFDGSESEPVEREIEVGISNISTAQIISGLEEGEEVALYDPRLAETEMSDDDLRRQRMAARTGR